MGNMENTLTSVEVFKSRRIWQDRREKYMRDSKVLMYTHPSGEKRMEVAVAKSSFPESKKRRKVSE